MSNLLKGIAGILLIVLLFALVSQFDFAPEPEEKTGVYIGDSVVETSSGAKMFKELLPPELTLVPPADEFLLCSDVDVGWCAETAGTATGTLKGYFGDGLEVRSFWKEPKMSVKEYRDVILPADPFSLTVSEGEVITKEKLEKIKAAFNAVYLSCPTN